MPMANMNWNAMPMEASTTLMIHVLIDGKEILLQALHNEEVANGKWGAYRVDKCRSQEVVSS